MNNTKVLRQWISPVYLPDEGQNVCRVYLYKGNYQCYTGRFTRSCDLKNDVWMFGESVILGWWIVPDFPIAVEDYD